MARKIRNEEQAAYNVSFLKGKDLLSSSDRAKIDEAKRLLFGSLKEPGVALTSPDATSDYLKLQLATLEHEVFGMLLLDNRRRVLADSVMFRGTIDGVSVHVREVVKEALNTNAAAVILYHNHPSCAAEPSTADRAITVRLRDALQMVDVRVLDHLVIGGSSHVSFAERGLI